MSKQNLPLAQIEADALERIQKDYDAVLESRRLSSELLRDDVRSHVLRLSEAEVRSNSVGLIARHIAREVARDFDISGAVFLVVSPSGRVVWARPDDLYPGELSDAKYWWSIVDRQDARFFARRWAQDARSARGADQITALRLRKALSAACAAVSLPR